MIYQIAGTIIVSISIVCFTWWLTTKQREERKKDSDDLSIRIASNEKLAVNRAWAMYEDERNRRIAAETKVGILETQLSRARDQMGKVGIKEVRHV